MVFIRDILQYKSDNDYISVILVEILSIWSYNSILNSIYVFAHVFVVHAEEESSHYKISNRIFFNNNSQLHLIFFYHYSKNEYVHLV